MASGDAATWVGSVSTSGTLLLGLILVARDHNGRERDRREARAAQARRVRLLTTAVTHSNVVQFKLNASCGVEVRNESDDTIHDIVMQMTVEPAKHVLYNHPGGVRREVPSLAGGESFSEDFTTRLHVPVDYNPNDPPRVSAVAWMEFTDAEGYRWKRDEERRLVALSQPRKRLWRKGVR